MSEIVSFADKVREELVLLNVEGETREEVLRNISKVLLEKGIVKDTFSDALLAREAEYPTGLAIGEINFAIPHTHPEHINEIAVTIAVPKHPVVFLDMGDQESEVMASVVVCLTLKKMDDNIKMLPALMEFFANEDHLRAILACTEPAQVMALLAKG